MELWPVEAFSRAPQFAPRVRPRGATASLTLSVSASSSALSLAPTFSAAYTTLSTPVDPRAVPRLPPPSAGTSYFRSFSTSSLRLAAPFRPPPSFYDPTSPSYRAAPDKSPTTSSPSPSPHLRPAIARNDPVPNLHIFHLLPSYLRPSYRALLRMIGLDPAVVEVQNADMANAQNAHYVDLRNRAIQERDLMVRTPWRV